MQSRLFLACLLFAVVPAASRGADETDKAPPAVAGIELGELTIGKTTYRDVRVRSRDARSVFFQHRSGFGSARLRDLAPELQARLGYDPASAPAEEPPPPPPRPAALSSTTAATRSPARLINSKLDALFLAYEKAPELRPKQSLQPDFIKLGLAAKNQGRRPSCAVYAIVSALEFQNARLTGSVEKLSEEYLIWATRRKLGGDTLPHSLLRDPSTGEFAEDAGFTLPSVISGLQVYGIPLYEDMRNQPGLAAADVPEPPPEVIEKARKRRLVFIAPVSGKGPEVILPRIIHALNAEFPVPVGLRWPHERAIHAGVLTTQQPQPNVFHAVTIVGYECPSGRIEDTAFIFKNSYGPQWGQGGYGRASWTYLSRNLLDAYVLDVRPTPDAAQ